MKNWSNTSLRYSDLENWLKILIIINLVFKLEIKPRKLSELNEFLAKFDLGGMLSLWSATAQWSLSGRSALYGLFHSTVNYSLWYRMIYKQSVFNMYNQHIAFYSRVSSRHPSNFFYSTFKIGPISFFCYLILTIESLSLFYLCLHKLSGTHWSCQYWNFRHLTKTCFDPSLNSCIYPTRQIVSLISF